MKISFAPPTIIGALCEREREIPAQLFRRFARLKPRIAFLPFQVERRHLKNVVACMRLMDVRGLAVFGRHQREIVRHLPSISPAARRAGRVDVVLRKGRRFQGHHVLTEIQERRQHSLLMGLDKRPASRRNAKKTRRSKVELMGLFCQAAVDLLTS